MITIFLVLGMLRCCTPLYTAATEGHLRAASALLKGGPDAGLRPVPRSSLTVRCRSQWMRGMVRWWRCCFRLMLRNDVNAAFETQCYYLTWGFFSIWRGVSWNAHAHASEH